LNVCWIDFDRLDGCDETETTTGETGAFALVGLGTNVLVAVAVGGMVGVTVGVLVDVGLDVAVAVDVAVGGTGIFVGKNVGATVGVGVDGVQPLNIKPITSNNMPDRKTKTFISTSGRVYFSSPRALPF
jgi:hypothetical protein